MTSGKRTPYLISFVAVMALLTAACANMGTPSGGPRDEDPPVLVSANPAIGSTEVKRQKLTLTFNELVNVKDAFSKVVVSPTSKSVPRVSSSGRNINVEFDSLSPNTTYTIDFADAIEDNNEGNKLEGFAFSFSTGATIDSLRISGRVLGARDLEPQQSMLVGVHSNLNDTAFTGTRMLRVAKTDDRGRFTIRGLAPGTYRVFALGDKDNDYIYSSPEEDMAFYEFTVEPSTQPAIATDTIYDVLTGKIDTVITRNRTQFLPNDIVLRSFNSGLRQQYLSNYERMDSTRVFIKFNTAAAALPDIKILGHPDASSLGTLEASEKLDSLVWWLSPELMRADSLQLAVTYPRSDQNMEVTVTTDTLNFYTKKLPAKKVNKKNIKKISRTDSIAAISTRFEITSPSAQDVHLPLLLKTAAPLTRFDTTAVHLEVLVDTTYSHAPGRLRVLMPDSLKPREFSIEYPWEYDTKYRLSIDSLAATDIYGKNSLPLSHEFKVKSPGEYCSVTFQVSGIGDIPAFVELLNGSDAVIRAVPVVSGEASFPFLTPGKYFARIVLDVNGNGEYDTGNYLLGLQPELVYYYPKVINIKKNWDRSEVWAVFDTPIDMMKPDAVLKNKPKSNNKRRSRKNTSNSSEEEEEEIFDPTRNPFDPNDRGANSRYR